MMSKLLKMSSIALAISLSACGGSSDSDDNSNNSGGSTPEVKTGIFIDSPVVGLGYQTPTHQGTTNASGEFSYTDGEQVTFYLDGFELGSTTAAAQVPVTKLGKTESIAMILQTLDTNPAGEIIDVTGVSLTAEQKANIERLFNREINIGQVGLSNLIDNSVAAEHVLANVGNEKWSEGLLAGRTFEDNGDESAQITISFNANYTGNFTEINASGEFTGTFSWGFDTTMNDLSLTIMADGEDFTAQFKLLGQQDNGVLDLFGVDSEFGSFLTEWTPVTQ